jgi:hypothetical protein
MIQIAKLLHNDSSVKFLSFVIGLGIAVLLFHKPFTRNVTLGLPVTDIEGKTVRHGDKCYEFHAEDVECEISDTK